MTSLAHNITSKSNHQLIYFPLNVILECDLLLLAQEEAVRKIHHPRDSY